MTYRVVFTRQARDDLTRLYDFLDKRDPAAGANARVAIRKAFGLLADFPFTCRKISEETSFLRELVISFGRAGYVALFEISDGATVTVLAVRHQRERDYL
ncbi:plasmid stabilization system [Salinisphaera sp. C84B14]|uniref:type II toxin-antitoxin system RelE/ParE family toxin n=1 Tax=Salinisphaera sp. C84B14 TaxID=1304155 RepID=UPI00333F1016